MKVMLLFFFFFLCSSNDTIDFKQKASCNKHLEIYSHKWRLQAVESTVGKTTEVQKMVNELFSVRRTNTS